MPCVFLRHIFAATLSLCAAATFQLKAQDNASLTLDTGAVFAQLDSGPPPRFPIVHDGRWGLIDSHGTVVVDPQYDDVGGCVSSGRSMAPRNAPQPVQDAGRLLDCGPLLRALIQVSADGKWGAIDPHGHAVIPARYDGIKIWGAFIAVQQGGRWGVVDRSGEYLVTPRFAQIMPVGNLAAVRSDEKWALIDTTGAAVLAAQLDREPALFSDDDFILAQRDGRWGLLSKAGAWVVEPRFERIYRFRSGLGNAMLDGKMGYIDSTGAWAIEPRFDVAAPFGPAGIALVTIDDHNQFIDRNGNVVIDGDFNVVHSFDGRLARAAVGASANDVKWGYIGVDGQWAVPPIYDDVSTFHEGLAAVTKDRRTSYIDQSGRVVMQLEYTGVDFHEGRAGIVSDEKWGYVDRNGTRVVEPRYDRTYEFLYGLALALVGDRVVYVDRDGKEVYVMEFPGFRSQVLVR